MPSNRRKPPLWIRLRELPGRVSERLSELTRAVVDTIERPFAWLGRGMLAAGDRVEGVDSLLLRLGRLLAWPFVALWRTLAAVVNVLLPESVRNVLTAPFRKTAAGASWLGHACWRLIERLNLDAPVRWLVWLLQPVWRPVAAVGGFLIAWLSTRSFRQLLWGLPALLLAGPLVFAGAWRTVIGHGGVAAEYRLASKRALEAKDYKSAQFYDRKLADLGDDTKMTSYRRAMSLADEGKYDEAYEILDKLSSVDEPTFPASHGWIVQALFSGIVEVDPQEAHRLAGLHLDALDKLEARSEHLDLLRGLWLAGANRHEEALKKFEPLALKYPEAALARMEIHLNQAREASDPGALATAREDAGALRDQIEKLKSSATPLTAQHYAWLSMAYEVLGNDDELTAALRGWLELDPDNERATTALAEIYRRQFDRLIRAAAPPIDRLVQLLCDAARHPASRIWAEAQIALLMRSRDSLAVAQSLVERLEASDDTPPVLIEEMGTWFAMQNDAQRAKELLSRSLGEDPSNAIAWNNLAWALYQPPDPDLDKALDAAGKALELMPGEYRFRETRGQIYALQGRWREAIDDLEAALNAMPDTPGIHETLAKAYDAVGDKDLAALHRSQAN